LVVTYVGVANRFDFEDATALGDFIKCTVNVFKEQEDLERLASGRPCGESRNIGKHDCGVGEKVGNWSRLVDADSCILILVAVHMVSSTISTINSAVQETIADVSGK
jgi:hypothetical protein